MQDQASWPTVDQLLSLSNEELGSVDPVVMNLAVAKGIPALAALDIGHYVELADKWAGEIERNIPAGDANFHRQPALWKNDLDFSRLAIMCWYVGEALGIRYREDQRKLERVNCTNPTDLFLNGVMDTRQGTCANMAVLHVAVSAGGGAGPCPWRVWVRTAFAAMTMARRFINIEASTANGAGSFTFAPGRMVCESITGHSATSSGLRIG